MVKQVSLSLLCRLISLWRVCMTGFGYLCLILLSARSTQKKRLPLLHATLIFYHPLRIQREWERKLTKIEPLYFLCHKRKLFPWVFFSSANSERINNLFDENLDHFFLIVVCLIVYEICEPLLDVRLVQSLGKHEHFIHLLSIVLQYNHRN